MRHLRAPVVLLALVAALAGCGSASVGSGPKPDGVGAMVRQAIVAADGAKSVRFDVRAETHATGTAVQDSDFPLGEDASVHLSGAVSSDAVTADVDAESGDDHYDAAVRVGPHELFAKLTGRWFGTTKLGLDDLRAQAKDEAEKQKPGLLEKLRTLTKAERIADEVLDGTVGEGPDGTWRFEGKLDADGIATVAREEAGEDLDADDLQVLRIVADASKVSFSIDQDDSLPRRLELRLDLSEDAAAQLKALDSTLEDADLDSLSVELTATFDDWGEPVEVEQPADFEPLDKLFEGIGLGDGGSGSLIPFPGSTS